MSIGDQALDVLGEVAIRVVPFRDVAPGRFRTDRGVRAVTEQKTDVGRLPGRVHQSL
jgi:hypothetical protein